MKLFVYEHITSGALIDRPLPESLSKEGNDILSAIVRDCHDLVEIELIVLRDSRLPSFGLLNDNTRHQCHVISNLENYILLWHQSLLEADAIFIIAPETDAILYQLQKQAFVQKKLVFGCQAEAIALATNKFLCDKHLDRYAIKTAKSCLANQWRLESFESADGYIVKPVDGAGCIDTLLFDSRDQLEHYLTQYDGDKLRFFMVQAYIKGSALSLSLLIGPDNVSVLSINRQKIIQSGNTLTFNGCVINDLNSHSFSLVQAATLAQQIQHAIPGLSGFVGIDLMLSLGDAIVIDINPRLTSSYVGLKQSLGLNPITLLLTMEQQGIHALPTLKQRQQVEISL